MKILCETGHALAKYSFSTEMSFLDLISNNLSDLNFDYVFGSVGFCAAGKKFNTGYTVLPYYWHSYAKIFAKFLLNADYKIYNYEDVVNMKADGNSIFIRPNTSAKIFHGQVVEKGKVKEKLQFYDIYHRDLVVISSVKDIKNEWRLFFYNRQYITGSQYNPNEDARVPDFVINFGQMIANNTLNFHDHSFVLDICETNEGILRLVEVNNFFSSGLYNADLECIIKALRKDGD